MSDMSSVLGERVRDTPPSGEDGGGEFNCSDCGRSFETAQGLGRHRASAHGVAGKSTRTKARKAKVKAKAKAKPLDRTRLLRAVFPKGVPANAAVVARTAAWLAEAESLSKAR